MLPFEQALLFSGRALGFFASGDFVLFLKVNSVFSEFFLPNTVVTT